jgi:hypothetical protein
MAENVDEPVRYKEPFSRNVYGLGVKPTQINSFVAGFDADRAGAI